MIIIFVVPAGFVHPSFPFPASRIRPTPYLPALLFHFHLLYGLPGTGFSSQTRRGVFDKLASPPPCNLTRFTSGPFLFIRQKAAHAVASLALVFFTLDYSPPLRDSSFPIYDRSPCSISISYLLLRTIIFFCLSLLPLSSKFGLPPLCVSTLAVVTFINLLLTSSLSLFFLT